MTEPSTDPRKWTYRRLAVFLSMFLAFSILAAAVWKDSSGAAAVAAVSGLTAFLTFLLLGYIFAPSLDEGWAALKGFLDRRGGSDGPPSS